jgi:hypothetical protein
VPPTIRTRGDLLECVEFSAVRGGLGMGSGGICLGIAGLWLGNGALVCREVVVWREEWSKGGLRMGTAATSSAGWGACA